MAAPIPPTGNYTQREVADFVLMLSLAGDDCRDKIKAIEKWVKEQSHD